MFDISGFFDNLNPERAVEVLRLKGFPASVRKWTKSFLTQRTASLKIGNHTSDLFHIQHGTPQGSPLSPILSALYTTLLLEITDKWVHRDLSLYVDDGTIYASSATTTAANEAAREGLNQILMWLDANGLSADSNKTELINFYPHRHNLHRHGPKITSLRYGHDQGDHVTNVSTLRYLGLYIDEHLKWDRHVKIMVTQACSTIKAVNLLGNSVRGLDFLNWRRVYNTLIIPVLTYGAPVWYTGVKQQGLLKRLAIAQNEGLHKITGTFRTTPVEPLHNMTGIPPIPYLMK